MFIRTVGPTGGNVSKIISSRTQALGEVQRLWANACWHEGKGSSSQAMTHFAPDNPFVSAYNEARERWENWQ